MSTTEREAVRLRVQELNDELVGIDDRRAAIKGQIEKAQADRFSTGEYADPDWFRRAKGALRHLGVERSEVCRELGDNNRRLRELNAQHSRDVFHDATREVVDDATWARIITRAEQMREGM